MKWIDTSDLELWASKPVAKADLPQLVSRLIRATTTKIKELNIPKGKSTNRGGWDGMVISSEATEFVPVGLSLWEFGTTGNVKGKADEDYEKRTADPEGYNISDATFIFVTPQVWEKGDEWVKEKKKEGKWKDIKVYNGTKLQEWLSIAPLQSYWLAKEIGRAPNDGVEAVEDFWDNWKTGPEYILKPEVITAGRENEINILSAALQGHSCVISVQASSRDEAVAFVIGSVLQFDTELQENTLSRCVIVESEGSFKSLVANNDQLVLIAKLESSNALNRAVSKGHFVILPLGPDEQFSGGVNLILPRLHRDRFVEALVASGLSREKAQSLSKESGRNITVVRRLERFDFDKPDWAKAENVRDIIPALLIGKWDENKEHDKQQVSSIANEPYDTYIAKLAKWKYTQDTPIYQVGSNWRISSPLDVWAHVCRYITLADLEKFKTSFLSAIQYVKPMFDLAPEQRYMSSFYGKETEYSGWAREGLVQSLILLGVYGDEFKLTTQHGSQAWVDGIIYSLLYKSDDGLWRSLNDVMPLLAEASPASFLAGVEAGLSGEAPVIMAVFEEASGGITPTSYHTGLLWALESLAWIPEYLSRVTLILAKLAIIDPGGRLGNRPANSLTQIFLPWHPQTYATLDQRLKTLETLTKNYPDIAWKLFLQLLPENRGVAFQSHKCRWRKFNFTDLGDITYAELYRSYSETVMLCMSIVGFDLEKIVELLDKSDSVSGADRQRILNYIKDNKPNITDPDHKIWAELRKTLGNHRSYPTARWAIPEADLNPYVELYDLFTPESVVDANKWILQDQWPILYDGREVDIDAKENEVLQRRVAALRAIENEIGLKGVTELVPQLTAHIAGNALAHLIENEDKLYEVFYLLRTEDKSKRDALHSLLFRVYFQNGFQWIINLYNRLNSEGKDFETLSDVLLPLPQNKEALDFVMATDDKVQQIYWSSFNPWFGQLDNEYAVLVIQKLIDAKRYGAIMRQMDFYIDKIPSELIYTILELAATQKSSDDLHRDTYSITRFFEELDKRAELDDKSMMQLEMYYLGVLTSYGSPRKPKLIHKDFATNPESFVEILKWIYKAKNDAQNEAEKEERKNNSALSMAGYQLLESWKIIPGTDETGKIDYNFLEEWIAQSRKLAEPIGRLEVADAEIAKILACYRGNGDSVWPSDEICKIIDNINTKSLRSNFRSAIFNSRGVTTRGIFDGGKQERELSAHFKNLAEQHAAKWPVTSSILADLANEYDAMGKQEDDHASQTDLDY